MEAGPWMDEVLLLTPGPTPIHPRAAAALHWPMRGHMDADVFAYNDAIVADLRTLYGADDDAFACLLSGSGSAGMEAGLINLLEPGERVLVASNGVFGERMVLMAERLGAEVMAVRSTPGEPLDPEAVRRAAQTFRPKVLSMVHGETSTGVINPLQEIAAVAAEMGALFSVDAVTTVGMQPFDMTAAGIDYAYTGSQKCLSAPPGLAPVAVSARAMAQVEARRRPVLSWYADFLGMRGYWALGEQGRRYHHTVPIHLHWATGEAIRAALSEGLDTRAQRAASVGAACLTALESVGFRAFVAEEARLPTVLAVLLPTGLPDAQVRDELRAHGVSLAGGLGPTAGRLWRLGLMGEGARPENYLRLMQTLASILPSHGLAAAEELPQRFEAAWRALAGAPLPRTEAGEQADGPLAMAS